MFLVLIWYFMDSWNRGAIRFRWKLQCPFAGDGFSSARGKDWSSVMRLGDGTVLMTSGKDSSLTFSRGQVGVARNALRDALVVVDRRSSGWISAIILELADSFYLIIAVETVWATYCSTYIKVSTSEQDFSTINNSTWLIWKKTYVMRLALEIPGSLKVTFDFVSFFPHNFCSPLFLNRGCHPGLIA